MPLHSQARGKGQHIDWSEEYKNTFDKVEEVLSKTVLLDKPQPNAPDSPTVDASNTDKGAQLEQRQSRSWILFGFFYRKSSDSELLVSYGAIRLFKHFLEGRPLPSSLTTSIDVYLINPNRSFSPPTRHLSFIAEFTTDILHSKGKFNVVVGALSRINAVGSSCSEDVVGNVDFNTLAEEPKK